MSDGTTESVTQEAETHPGDKGMAVIAEKVLEQVKNYSTE